MPDFSQLTERQREIYEFIRDKIETRGYGRRCVRSARPSTSSANGRDVPSERPREEGADHSATHHARGSSCSLAARLAGLPCWAALPPARRSRRRAIDSD